MGKQLRAIVIFLIVLGAGGTAVFLWLPTLLNKPSVVRLPPGVKPPGSPEIEKEKLPVPVKVFKATRIEFTDVLPTLGTVRGQSEVDLKFETNGVVNVLEFREGDLVSQGQLLAGLDDREARLRVDYAASKVDTAQSQLNLAKQKLKINEDLFKIGAIIEAKLKESQLEGEQAMTQLKTAQRETDLAKNEVTKTVLHAPIAGVMGTREAEVGEYVTPQVVIATLMDVESVYVELGIIERDIEKIRLGQKVRVTVDSLPNIPFEGTIDNLAPLIEGKSRTLTAKVKVENPRGQLLPGMFARAEIAVYEKPDALVIPTSALRDADSDGKFESVLLVEDNVARARSMTLGYLTTDYAEIADGLREGEQVITEARGPIEDGTKVSLLEEEEAGIQRVEPAIGPKKEEFGE